MSEEITPEPAYTDLLGRISEAYESVGLENRRYFTSVTDSRFWNKDEVGIERIVLRSWL